MCEKETEGRGRERDIFAARRDKKDTRKRRVAAQVKVEGRFSLPVIFSSSSASVFMLIAAIGRRRRAANLAI